jgi:hypothetical protein
MPSIQIHAIKIIITEYLSGTGTRQCSTDWFLESGPPGFHWPRSGRLVQVCPVTEIRLTGCGSRSSPRIGDPYIKPALNAIQGADPIFGGRLARRHSAATR